MDGKNTVLAQFDTHMPKNKTKPSHPQLSPCTKKILDLNLKPKTIKPLENLGDLFLRYNIESMIHKKKIDTLDIIKINICSSKDTAYKMSIDR